MSLTKSKLAIKFQYYLSKIVKRAHFKSISNSYIHESSSIGAGTNFINSTMSRHSFCGYDCTIVNTEIGAFCSIASNCEIGGASHSIDWISTSPVFNENPDQIKAKFAKIPYDYSSKTEIGNDVWIGSKALIKAGVKIGNGAVIGMGSVVTKDVGDFEIWAGNPAKLIRKRFDNETITQLQMIKWWEFSEADLVKYGPLFNQVELFLAEVK